MSEQIRIADLRQLVQRRTQGWKPISDWGPVCAGCGAAEYRLDGYCSLECRDYHSDEDFDSVAALIDAVEAAHATTVVMKAAPRGTFPHADALRDALARFDFGQEEDIKSRFNVLSDGDG